MKGKHTPTHLVNIIGTLLAGILLGGCATTISQPIAADNSPIRASAPNTAPPSAPPRKLPQQELTGSLLYQIMVAEFAERQGMLALSAHGYLTAAHTSRDPRLAQKGTQMAIYAKDRSRALQGAQLWAEIEPDHPEANQTLLTLQVLNGQLEQATPRLRELLNPELPQYRANLTTVVGLLATSKQGQPVLTLFDEVTQSQTLTTEVLFAGASLATHLELLDDALQRIDTLLFREFHQQGVLLKVQLLNKQQKKEDALKFIFSQLNKHPNSTTLRLSYARQLIAMEQTKAALVEFRILVTSAPKDADIRYGLGVLALQDGSLAEAKTQFLKLLELQNRVDESRFILGGISEQEGDMGAAIEWYRTVGISNHYFEAHYQAALLMSQRDGVDSAIAHLRQLEKPHERDILRFLIAEGNLYQQYDHPQDAYESFTQALAIAPDEPVVLYARAMVAIELDRIEILEQDLGHILKNDPNHSQALNALGYTLADQTDRLEEALGYISKAYELEGDTPAVLDSLGWVYYRLERYEEALPYLNKAAELQDDAEIYIHLIEALWAVGHKDQAFTIWNRLQKFAPDNPLLQRVEHYFR